MEKLKYSKLNYSLQYSPAGAHAILANFIEHYVDEEKLKRYILMWNSFIYKPRCLLVEAIQDIARPSDKVVFFYDDREKNGSIVFIKPL